MVSFLWYSVLLFPLFLIVLVIGLCGRRRQRHTHDVNMADSSQLSRGNSDDMAAAAPGRFRRAGRRHGAGRRLVAGVNTREDLADIDASFVDARVASALYGDSGPGSRRRAGPNDTPLTSTTVSAAAAAGSEKVLTFTCFNCGLRLTESTVRWPPVQGNRSYPYKAVVPGVLSGQHPAHLVTERVDESSGVMSVSSCAACAALPDEALAWTPPSPRLVRGESSSSSTSSPVYGVVQLPQQGGRRGTATNSSAGGSSSGYSHVTGLQLPRSSRTLTRHFSLEDGVTLSARGVPADTPGRVQQRISAATSSFEFSPRSFTAAADAAIAEARKLADRRRERAAARRAEARRRANSKSRGGGGTGSGPVSRRRATSSSSRSGGASSSGDDAGAQHRHSTAHRGGMRSSGAASAVSAAGVSGTAVAAASRQPVQRTLSDVSDYVGARLTSLPTQSSATSSRNPGRTGGSPRSRHNSVGRGPGSRSNRNSLTLSSSSSAAAAPGSPPPQLPSEPGAVDGGPQTAAKISRIGAYYEVQQRRHHHQQQHPSPQQPPPSHYQPRLHRSLSGGLVFQRQWMQNQSTVIEPFVHPGHHQQQHQHQQPPPPPHSNVRPSPRKLRISPSSAKQATTVSPPRDKLRSRDQSPSRTDEQLASVPQSAITRSSSADGTKGGGSKKNSARGPGRDLRGSDERGARGSSGIADDGKHDDDDVYDDDDGDEEAKAESGDDEAIQTRPRPASFSVVGPPPLARSTGASKAASQLLRHSFAPLSTIYSPRMANVPSAQEIRRQRGLSLGLSSAPQSSGGGGGGGTAANSNALFAYSSSPRSRAVSLSRALAERSAHAMRSPRSLHSYDRSARSSPASSTRSTPRSRASSIGSSSTTGGALRRRSQSARSSGAPTPAALAMISDAFGPGSSSGRPTPAVGEGAGGGGNTRMLRRGTVGSRSFHYLPRPLLSDSGDNGDQLLFQGQLPQPAGSVPLNASGSLVNTGGGGGADSVYGSVYGSVHGVSSNFAAAEQQQWRPLSLNLGSSIQSSDYESVNHALQYPHATTTATTTTGNSPNSATAANRNPYESTDVALDSGLASLNVPMRSSNHDVEDMLISPRYNY